MGRGSSGAGKGGGGGGLPSGGSLSNIPVNATVLTDAQADALRQQQDSMYDPNTTAAVKMYISNTNFDGQGHSLSQTMNYLEDNGVDLSTATPQSINQQFGLRLNANEVASMQYTSSIMDVAGHPLGQDTLLVRGAHDDMLRKTFGIQDYSKMSESQLQSKLVGQGFTTGSNMSTSYDVKKNPFLSASSGSGVSGGREVVYNIKAGANTKVLFGAKSQSEVVIGKGTNFKITGVRYSGKTVQPRNSKSKPQIVLDIETI